MKKFIVGSINSLLKDRKEGAEKTFLRLQRVISLINTILELLTKIAVRLKDGELTDTEAETTLSDVKQTLTLIFKNDK